MSESKIKKNKIPIDKQPWKPAKTIKDFKHFMDCLKKEKEEDESKNKR